MKKNEQVAETEKNTLRNEITYTHTHDVDV